MCPKITFIICHCHGYNPDPLEKDCIAFMSNSLVKFQRTNRGASWSLSRPCPPGVEFHGTAIQFFDFYCRQQLTKEIHTSCISRTKKVK